MTRQEWIEEQRRYIAIDRAEAEYCYDQYDPRGVVECLTTARRRKQQITEALEVTP